MTQFHPEELFEWHDANSQSLEGIKAQHAFAEYFLQLAHTNTHIFPSISEINQRLVENYRMVFD